MFDAVLWRIREDLYTDFCRGFSPEFLANLHRVPVSAIEQLLETVEIEHNGKNTIPQIPETFAISEIRKRNGQRPHVS